MAHVDVSYKLNLSLPGGMGAGLQGSTVFTRRSMSG